MDKSLITGLPLFKRGKVRDIYDLGDRLLIVASDRISCFDVVLPTKIPGKGKILTALSAYWFREMEDVVGSHLLILRSYLAIREVGNGFVALRP
jgi:phosphoribosylaminoimidazole-succinocarboxamide synthase